MQKLLLYFVASFILSSGVSTNALAQNRVELILDELDEVIRDKSLYHHQFELRMDSVKLAVSKSTDPQQRYELCGELYNNYLHFQADSALYYVGVMAKMVESYDELQSEDELAINRAEAYGVMGMYSETLHELKSVSVNKLDSAAKGYYYRTYRAYYGWIADYTAVEPAKDKYLQMADIYRDSVLMFEPIEVNRSMIEVEKQINQNRLDRAVEMLHELSESTSDNKQQAYIHYNMSLIYLKKNDIESAIYYLAKTAIFDLKMGTREYASLQHLAYELYQSGELNRAYNYLSCSMEDAVASNARLRFMEVAKYYPIIDRAYRDMDDQRRSTTNKLLLSVSLVTIFVIAFAIYLLISRRRLAAVRADLHKTNESLVSLNKRMAETGRIKEVYIARYLERCVTYIDKFDLYRRSLKRLASASKIEELVKVLKSDKMLQLERKEFYTEFDRSFLTLFPNFVSDFNELLHDGDQMKLKAEGQLNTELRIFALIRLGVTDAAQIAHFLGYSLATVYSYRSKMRNRALVDKDTFEHRVMEL